MPIRSAAKMAIPTASSIVSTYAVSGGLASRVPSPIAGAGDWLQVKPPVRRHASPVAVDGPAVPELEPSCCVQDDLS